MESYSANAKNTFAFAMETLEALHPDAGPSLLDVILARSGVSQPSVSGEVGSLVRSTTNFEEPEPKIRVKGVPFVGGHKTGGPFGVFCRAVVPRGHAAVNTTHF